MALSPFKNYWLNDRVSLNKKMNDSSIILSIDVLLEHCKFTLDGVKIDGASCDEYFSKKEQLYETCIQKIESWCVHNNASQEQIDELFEYISCAFEGFCC